nr:hypothetical protein [Tanacetum cinerariifolium]
SDYLRTISLKMLSLETGSHNPMPDAMQANNGSMASGHQAPSISDMSIDNVSTSGPEGGPSMESGDWRVQLQADSRKRIVNK